jgi:imidazolonepropionase-like amidohydrolase
VAERSAACVAERSAACVAERSAACVAERSGGAELPANKYWCAIEDACVAERHGGAPMTGFVVTNAQLLDAAAGERRPGVSVSVEKDRIVEVAEDGAAVSRSEDMPVLDAGGRTLMPGLIDAHVHAAITTMDLTAMARRSPTRVGIEAKTVLERMLLRGFTTVRDAGGMDAGIQESLRAGLITGPRVFRSGRVLSQTGGHGDIAPASNDPHIGTCAISSSSFAHIADGPDAVRRAAREELKGGADQIKVMAGGGVATPTDPIDMVQYTEEEIRAAVAEAAARRTYAFAHAYIPEAITRAVRAGVRSIEHGNLIDDAAASVMAQHGCYLVPTLVIYDQVAQFGRALNFPAESLAKLNDVFGAGLASIDIALAAGVEIGFGTDLLGETHDAQSRELALRAKMQTAAEVIRSATTVNAALLGRPGELGVIAPGAYADFLLVDGDPLLDIGLLEGQGEHLDLIVRAGEIVRNTLS